MALLGSFPSGSKQDGALQLAFPFNTRISGSRSGMHSNKATQIHCKSHTSTVTESAANAQPMIELIFLPTALLSESPYPSTIPTTSANTQMDWLYSMASLPRVQIGYLLILDSYIIFLTYHLWHFRMLPRLSPNYPELQRYTTFAVL